MSWWRAQREAQLSDLKSQPLQLNAHFLFFRTGGLSRFTTGCRPSSQTERSSAA
jgi:hypothetical protein